LQTDAVDRTVIQLCSFVISFDTLFGDHGHGITSSRNSFLEALD